MNAREELLNVLVESGLNREDETTQQLADNILAKLPELGFVRLEDVEIDKEKLMEFLFDKDEFCLQAGALTKVIASAKPIKTKEKK